MRPDQLDAIRARCAAATPGIDGPGTHWTWLGEEGDWPQASKLVGGEVVINPGSYEDAWLMVSAADREFIAHAREDVPALLAEVDRLELAATALAALVRDEYPEQYTLAEIAGTWGSGITYEQIEALRTLEARPVAADEADTNESVA